MKLDSDAVFTKSDKETINHLLERFPTNTQFAIAKIHNAQSHFYGVSKSSAGIEETDNRHAIFEIGSITKVLTSSILANYVIKRTVKLDDPIDQYLGYPLNKNVIITLKELSFHTAGLPRIPPGLFWEAVMQNKDNPYKDFDEQRLVTYLKTRLKRKRNNKSRYSNLGAGLLGYVLTKVENKPYEVLLQEALCRPVQMQETTSKINSVSQPLVTGLDKKGKPTPNWDLNILVGAGGVLSSVNDLAIFIQANFNGQLECLRFQRDTRYKINMIMDAGLGWQILKTNRFRECELYIHDGGTGGYHSIIGMDVESKKGVVILTNVSGLLLFKGRKIDSLALELYKNM